MFFSIQLGMSSSQLTLTPSFFKGVGLNHQPVTSQRFFQDILYQSHWFAEEKSGKVCVDSFLGISQTSEPTSFHTCFFSLSCESSFSLHCFSAVFLNLVAAVRESWSYRSQKPFSIFQLVDFCSEWKVEYFCAYVVRLTVAMTFRRWSLRNGYHT